MTLHATRTCFKSQHARRGSAILVVLWAVALGGVVVASLQFSAQRQVYTGFESLERVRARWAARAGVERMIAVLSYHTEFPETDDAFALYRDFAEKAYSEEGDLAFANYAVQHERDNEMFAGPLDEHTRFNINLATENREPLENLYITPDVVDSIIDWVDEDDQVSGQGAEAPYYLSGGYFYQPRNSFMRSTAELELIIGAYPEDVRGEDWNYNNLFDPNEDDGDLLLPRDNANGVLERGWASSLTAYSVGGGLGASGEPRIFIPEATVDEIRDRTGTSIAQAEALLSFGQNPNNDMSMLWTTPINMFDEQGNALPVDGPPGNEALPFETNQLMQVFGELTMDDPSFRQPGRINLNTVSEELLRDVLRIDPAVADEIIYHRERSAQGFVSLVELVGISPEFTAPVMEQMAQLFDVTSNVFTITSTGVSTKTGTRVQLIVVVDRSTLPVTILEYREQ